MRLYHFDARGVGGMLAVDSRMLPDPNGARRHAVQFAASLAGQLDLFDPDGGVVVVDA